MPAHGIMFHHFHGERHPPVQGSMSAAELAELIQFVGRERLRPAREWLGRALHGSLEEGDLCLTFDDNLRCQYDVALPVLRDFGITAFWFVQTSVLEGNLERLEIYRTFRTRCFETVEAFYESFYEVLDPHELLRALARFDPTSYLADYPFYSDADREFRYVRDELLGPERYMDAMDRLIAARGQTLAGLAEGLWMTPGQLCGLHAEGHVIGLHSHTHPTRMAELPVDVQRNEYQQNHRFLASLLGAPPTVVSHPCNSYGGRTLAILQRLGVQVGFRANMVLWEHGPLEYPREDHANVLREMQGCGSAYSPATSPAM